MTIEQEYTALKERLQRVEDDRDGLRTQLFEQENQSKQLKMMENSTLKSNMTLEQELMSRTLDAERLQLELSELNSKHDYLKADLLRTKDLLLEVEEAKEELQDDVELLQERIENIEKEMDGTNNLNTTLQEKYRSLENTRDELQEIKDQLENEIACIKKEKDALYQELSELSEQTLSLIHI